MRGISTEPPRGLQGPARPVLRVRPLRHFDCLYVVTSFVNRSPYSRAYSAGHHTIVDGKNYTTDTEYMHESLHKRRTLFNMHKRSVLALYNLNKNNYTKLVFSIVPTLFGQIFLTDKADRRDGDRVCCGLHHVVVCLALKDEAAHVAFFRHTVHQIGAALLLRHF